MATRNRGMGSQQVETFVRELLGEDVHAMRVLSVSDAVTGVMQAAALGIHMIGRGLAEAVLSAVQRKDRALAQVAENGGDSPQNTAVT